MLMSNANAVRPRTPQPSSTLKDIYCVDFGVARLGTAANPAVGWASGDAGYIGGTSNGGSNWTDYRNTVALAGGSVQPLYACAKVDNLTAFVAGAAGVVMSTQSGGLPLSVNPSNLAQRTRYLPALSGPVAGPSHLPLRLRTRPPAARLTRPSPPPPSGFSRSAAALAAATVSGSPASITALRAVSSTQAWAAGAPSPAAPRRARFPVCGAPPARWRVAEPPPRGRQARRGCC